MKPSIHVVLFFLLSLVTSMALPRRQAQARFAVVDFTGKAACHSILTSCRVDADCCADLKCGVFDEDALCVPAG
jgi:hypothetical protein